MLEYYKIGIGGGTARTNGFNANFGIIDDIYDVNVSNTINYFENATSSMRPVKIANSIGIIGCKAITTIKRTANSSTWFFEVNNHISNFTEVSNTK